MEKNEIKKFLYKNNPEATLVNIKKDRILYIANGENGRIWFSIPFSEVGDAEFFNVMESKLLIRYLI